MSWSLRTSANSTVRALVPYLRRLPRTYSSLQRARRAHRSRCAPGFPNSRWARDCGLPSHAIWHHHAHAGAVAGEYSSKSPLLCFTWDGVGLGSDGTLWGGEALLGRPGQWTRVASFRTFRLPGGERAAREPWRSALALCWECGRSWTRGIELGGPLLRRAFDAGVNAPVDERGRAIVRWGGRTDRASPPDQLRRRRADVPGSPVRRQRPCHSAAAVA